jgi:hypothetical protein
VVDREERRVVTDAPISFSIAINKQILQNNMRKLITITAIIVAMSSCKSTKYHTCDAYKTQYKQIKPEKHKHHGLCDAYN